ncbi:MAG TPA: response regulator [Polyangiaceae bacterium]
MEEESRTEASPLVLLVDDDEDSRFLYAQYLTGVAGYRVAEASDGRRAIEAASTLRPDVVIMDLSLPNVTGWEAMRALRSGAATRTIPIVALTGHTQVHPQDQGASGALEFDAILVKPCLPKVLVERVEALLRR